MKNKLILLLLMSNSLLFAQTNSNDSVYSLKDVEVYGEKIGLPKITPHAIEITTEQVSQFSFSEEMPTIIGRIPGVFTISGVGIGDIEIKIRGFNVDNIQFLINGMPEAPTADEGWVYWSNYTGIEDYIQKATITKGITNNHPYSKPGGTILLQLTEATQQKFTRVSTTYSQNVGNKINFIHSSGLVKNGFAYAFGGTYRYGSSFKDGTWFKGGNYFMNLSKSFSEKYQLSLYVFGTTQNHAQASTYMPDRLVKYYGIKYNPDWGYKDGIQKSAALNFYHRRFAQLFFNADFSTKTMLKSSLYYDAGNGGATRNFGNSLPILNGQIDFDAAISENISAIDTIYAPDSLMNRGYNATHFLGNYIHTNAILTYIGDFTHIFPDSSNLSLGAIAYTTLYIHDYANVEDLLGADFVSDGSNLSQPFRLLVKGDKLWYNQNSERYGYGLSTSYSKTLKKLSLAISGSFIMSSSRKTNLFGGSNADDNTTDLKWFPSINIKGSISYLLSKSALLYATSGFQKKRVPFYSLGKTTVENINPEQFFSAETGCRFAFSGLWKGELNTSIFIIQRQNLTFVKYYNNFGTNETFIYSVQGLNSKHYGAEILLNNKFSNRFDLMLSLTGIRVVWQNNIHSLVTDQSGNILDTINLNAKGLIEGGQPGISLYLIPRYRIIKDFWIFTELKYFGMNRSEFNIRSAENSLNPQQSWKLPDYLIIDAGASYTLTLKNKSIFNVILSITNVANNRYISQSIDGIMHNRESASVLYGIGRSFSIGLKYEF